MAGIDLRTIAELLGTERCQMLIRYSHLAPEHRASAVERLIGGKIDGTPKRTRAVLREGILASTVLQM